MLVTQEIPSRSTHTFTQTHATPSMRERYEVWPQLPPTQLIHSHRHKPLFLPHLCSICIILIDNVCVYQQTCMQISDAAQANGRPNISILKDGWSYMGV